VTLEKLWSLYTLVKGDQYELNSATLRPAVLLSINSIASSRTIPRTCLIDIRSLPQPRVLILVDLYWLATWRFQMESIAIWPSIVSAELSSLRGNRTAAGRVIYKALVLHCPCLQMIESKCNSSITMHFNPTPLWIILNPFSTHVVRQYWRVADVSSRQQG